MKKILAALSAFLLVVSLVSCGGDQPASSAGTGSDTAVVSSEAEKNSGMTASTQDASSEAVSSVAVSSASNASKASSSKVTSSKTVSSKSATSTTSSKAETTTKKYPSMKAYVESAEAQAEIEASKEAIEAMGMSVKLTAEGDKMVYTYTYLQQLQIDDTVKAALKESLNAQTNTFTTLANTLKTVVDVSKPSIVLRYLNADGTEIISQEFKAD